MLPVLRLRTCRPVQTFDIVDKASIVLELLLGLKREGQGSARGERRAVNKGGLRLTWHTRTMRSQALVLAIPKM